MPASATILIDSVCAGARLTSFALTYPRMVHAELMTHRHFSRNASSSRAIPIEKMIAAVKNDPAMPVFWGKNQSGMQAREELTGLELEQAKTEWLRGRDMAVIVAQRLSSVGLHKQLANRVLEPWMWITVIVSATDYANWFAQRLHEDAQPEIQHLAQLMKAEYDASVPTELKPGEWHLPLIQPDELADVDISIETLQKVSVARCARVSYLTHKGVRSIDKDLELFERLCTGGNNGHWSPVEHVATPLWDPELTSGNFTGWQQFRKSFPNECIKQEPYVAPIVPVEDMPIVELTHNDRANHEPTVIESIDATTISVGTPEAA